VNWDWSRNPIRLDPSRGLMLCEPCWNSQHLDPPYKDKDGVRHPKVANCLINKYQGKGGCECGCLEPKPAKIRFTGKGQEKFNFGAAEGDGSGGSRTQKGLSNKVSPLAKR
jgi:hypothetical protein